MTARDLKVKIKHGNLVGTVLSTLALAICNAVQH